MAFIYFQFAKLTQSYEKLQLHQLKQNKTHSVEKCTENQEAPFQMNSLNQKLEVRISIWSSASFANLVVLQDQERGQEGKILLFAFGDLHESVSFHL